MNLGRTVSVLDNDGAWPGALAVDRLAAVVEILAANQPVVAGSRRRLVLALGAAADALVARAGAALVVRRADLDRVEAPTRSVVAMAGAAWAIAAARLVLPAATTARRRGAALVGAAPFGAAVAVVVEDLAGAIAPLLGGRRRRRSREVVGLRPPWDGGDD
jgi:hypothetical protein